MSGTHLLGAVHTAADFFTYQMVLFLYAGLAARWPIGSGPVVPVCFSVTLGGVSMG